jgi:hypothetical protein
MNSPSELRFTSSTNTQPAKFVPSAKFLAALKRVIENANMTYRPPKKMTRLNELLQPPAKSGKKATGKQYVYCSDPLGLQFFGYYLHLYSGGYLIPYTNETLKTVMAKAKQGFRYFIFTENKKSVRKPLNLVTYKGEDKARGLFIASGQNTFERYKQKWSLPGKKKNYVADTDLPEGINDADTINLKGDLIQIMLATSESFKGVDMKGVSGLHLMDTFLDFQDLLQFMGRGPRMCSHSKFPEPQRQVELNMYFAVNGREVVRDDAESSSDEEGQRSSDEEEAAADEEEAAADEVEAPAKAKKKAKGGAPKSVKVVEPVKKEIVYDGRQSSDIWLLKQGQTNYRAFLEPMNDAFADIAIDRDVFKVIHADVKANLNKLLTLNPAKGITVEKVEAEEETPGADQAEGDKAADEATDPTVGTKPEAPTAETIKEYFKEEPVLEQVKFV